MVKLSYSNSDDQHDKKVFRESLGTFGTTTNPVSGQNQLAQLQAKIREGVKHVEIALGGVGKGNFGALDTPDKYGQEQRRTIMQLAKLNQQRLSVHATFNVTSFSGIGQGGFEESNRLNAIKEIDETVKFAAETAKGGAVVVHLQGDMLSNDKSELNLSGDYIKWLKKNKPEEFEKINKEYFDSNSLNRKFVNNPLNIIEAKEDFERLKSSNLEQYNKYLEKSKLSKNEPWQEYYKDKNIQKLKLAPERSPLVIVGDKIEQTPRGQEFLDLTYFKDISKFSESEKNLLKNLDINLDNFNLEELQKTQSLFSNQFPLEFKGKISEKDFMNLKSKFLIDYNKVLKENYNLQAQADKVFHKRLLEFQIGLMNLQKEDLETNYTINEDYLNKINELKKKEQQLAKDLENAKKSGDLNQVTKIRKQLNEGSGFTDEKRDEFNEIMEKIQNPTIPEAEKSSLEKEAKQIKIDTLGIQSQKNILMQEVGLIEYQKLEKYNEMKSQFNEKIRDLEEQKNNVKAVVDETFNKNISAIAHLGIKALKYQLDLKEKSVVAKEKVSKLNNEILDLKKKYDNCYDPNEQNKLSFEIQKLKTEQRKYAGMSDYNDIDLINNPLYVAPENMLPGMGSITSIEEFKAAIRMAQQDFAKRILGKETEYIKIKEEYEKQTGLKIKTQEDAMALAKRHLAGTFDNAHAASWIKHFRAEKGESEEHKIDRFNKWLNSQAESMVKEGLVKHIHFNDTLGKDDDHNMLGTGILDLHDLRERLRKAGVKEALIVEAGGRASHMANSFDFFNPTTQNINIEGPSFRGLTVSDWISVERNYQNRPQYSHYGMNYNTFKHQPQQGQQKGEWSGTSFF